MGLVFVVLAAVMVGITLVRPRTEPVRYPVSKIDTTVPRSSYLYGSGIILLTIALYVVFR